MAEGASAGRPTCFCGVVPVLDGGFLPCWMCRGCRGAASIVDAAMQGWQTSPHLFYYMR